MMLLKNIPKSESIEFDKYQAPVTVSSNVEVSDMVRKLMAIDSGQGSRTFKSREVGQVE